MLNEEEFVIAEFLVYVLKRDGTLPHQLPQELIDSAQGIDVEKKSSKPKVKKSVSRKESMKTAKKLADEAKDVSGKNDSGTIRKNKSSKKKNPWALSSAEKKKYQEIFAQKNQDGFIDGPTAVALFSKSQLPKADLAKIWTLSDMDNDSKLSMQEFFIALHLITRRVNGGDIPDSVPVDLAISASRIKKGSSSNTVKSNSNNSSLVYMQPSASVETVGSIAPSSSIPDIDGYTNSRSGTMRRSMIMNGSFAEDLNIQEYDASVDFAKLEAITDLEQAMAFAQHLTEDINNLSLQIEKQKIQTESLRDKVAFKQEQIQLAEKRKETFSNLLNNYSTDAKEEEEHLKSLQSELKVILAEIEESHKTELKKPHLELQALRERKKALQTEYKTVKQDYDKDRDEYKRLVLEIEKIKAEYPDTGFDFDLDAGWNDYGFKEDFDNSSFDTSNFNTSFESFDFQPTNPSFQMAFESGTLTPVMNDFDEQEDFNFGWVAQSGVQTPKDQSDWDFTSPSAKVTEDQESKSAKLKKKKSKRVSEKKSKSKLQF